MQLGHAALPGAVPDHSGPWHVSERTAWPGHCCAKSAKGTGQQSLQDPLIWMFACSLWVCLAPGLHPGIHLSYQPNVAACASEVISGDAKEWLISV